MLKISCRSISHCWIGLIQQRKFHLHPITILRCLALRFSWRWNVWSYTATHGLRLACCLQRPLKHTKLSAIKKVRACIITWNDSNKVHVGKGTRLYCDKPVSLQQDTRKNGIICYVIGKYTQLVFSQGFPASCKPPTSILPHLCSFIPLPRSS